MRKLTLTLVLALYSMSVVAWPYLQQNGRAGRIVNEDNMQYYCWIEYVSGHTEGWMLYPGQASRWYEIRLIKRWGCE